MKVSEALSALLYPPACLLCRRPLPLLPKSAGGAASLCPACVSRLPRSEPPLCNRCGVGVPGAFDAVVECGRCRRVRPAFEMARAPWLYRGAAQEAVRQFKYHRHWRIGRWLAEDMARVAGTEFPLDDVDAILPVPLHWLKRRCDGFAAVGRLSREVARSLAKPCLARALRRRRWTATQTRLRWRQRSRNVRDAFAARPGLVRDRSLLLVDDVLTSGATANACALALKAAGARRVFVLTAARTPLSP